MTAKKPASAVLMGSLSAASECFDFLMSDENFDLVAVVCRDDDPRQVGEQYVIDRARRAGVAVCALDNMPSADVGIAVRFDRILTPAHRARFSRGVVNLHGAPLPEMRGSLCECAAILEGREQFGASLHLMDDGIDTGPLLHVERFVIAPDATAGSLLREANALGIEMIKEYLHAYIEGELEPMPQEKRAGLTYRKVDVLARRQVPADAGPAEHDRVRRAFCYDPKGLPARSSLRERLIGLARRVA
ncbi:formyltransferase family protein [Erythrobacter sp.]|jgi:methionyl-tRNA formyltransferase|uniref:formyltransferase family protein n=1 Tax=Erythrobacter sp. TaxID=1042 RepID=UPI002ECBB470|nr:formyltransferase family protein [Erythrobacter sp.]